MRYDLFIIWGNGLNFIPDIIYDIREDENYKILRLKYHRFDNTEKFIKNIYKCDSVPIRHLMSKTKYLLKSPQRIMSVLVKNYDPKELEMGSGDFKHIQCERINQTKLNIRSKFNPFFKNLNKRINPLPKGVSHEHCIHATDYESQTEYLLKFLNLKNIAFYKRYDDLNIEIPWHLSLGKNNIIKNVNLNELKCSVIDRGIVQIEDTPHFQYVQGYKNSYIEYVNKNIGEKLQEDHYPESFEKLINNFDKNYNNKRLKKSYIIVNKENVILDGLHRASILKNIGSEIVECLQI
mgnify:FL=1